MPKRDSTVVTVLCGLGLAIAFLAIGASFIPYLGTVAVLISAPAVLIGAAALALAVARSKKLILPALTLLVAAAPAARSNWKAWQTVWVESAELCHPPDIMLSAGVFGLVGGLIEQSAYVDAVGKQVCDQLGKSFTDHSCGDEAIGRIKCEP